jgi:hypothetical protein
MSPGRSGKTAYPAGRLAEPLPPRYTNGVLAKYARLVSLSPEAAVTG